MDGIFKIDMQWTILDANPAFNKLLGFNNNEKITGRNYKEFTPEKWQAFEDQIIQDNVLKKGRSDKYKKEFIRPDGTLVPVTIQTWLISDCENAPIIGGIVRDITEIWKANFKLKQALQHLEDLNRYKMDEREKERKALASSIHDGVGQTMTALHFDLHWLRENVVTQDVLKTRLDRMIGMTNEVIGQMQQICGDLRPGIIDDLGLAAAIEWYCKEFEERSGLKCYLQLGSCRMKSDCEIVLFRLIQEALTNVLRHAQATTVKVALNCSNSILHLSITDDGVGIPKEKINNHQSFGLIGMRERVQYCGGDMAIQCDSGTTIDVYIPI